MRSHVQDVGELWVTSTSGIASTDDVHIYDCMDQTKISMEQLEDYKFKGSLDNHRGPQFLDGAEFDLFDTETNAIKTPIPTAHSHE